MDLVSAVTPGMAPFFGELATAQPTPALPTNFWALLLSPVDLEPPIEEIEAAPPEVKAASPQQIAQAVILSMLSPVVASAPSGPDPEQVHVVPVFERNQPDEKPVEQAEIPDSPELPVVPLAVPLPEAPPLAVRVDPPVEPETAPRVQLPQAPRTSIATAPARKNPPEAPVAFELRLTQEQPEEPDKKELPASEEIRPTREPAEHPRIQRKEAASLASGAHEAPLPHKPLPILTNVAATPRPHETQAIDPPRPATSEAPAVPVLIQAPKPVASSAPIREIAMRVPAPDSNPVDVRVTGRNGEVHVAVRTSDTGLQLSLQEELGSLVGKLEQAGFRAEASIPNTASPHSFATHSTADLSGPETYREPQDAHGESNGRGTNPDSRHSNDRQQQQQHRRITRAWEQMMEDMQ